MQPQHIFQHHTFPDYLIRLAEAEDDLQLLALVSETMPSNGMLLAFQRQPSYFHATQVQYHHPEIVVVVHRHQPQQLIAMMNIGKKALYVDGKRKLVRYVSDLRIGQAFRSKKAIEFLMLYLKHRLEPHEFVQSIVLKDNLTARHILHQPRAYFPQPYIYDELTTFTISKVKSMHQDLPYRVERFSNLYIDAVELFLNSMRQFYNFMPDYRYSDLEDTRNTFWRDLRSENIYLVIAEDQSVIGMFGLWDQKKFKQTKVIHYNTLMRMIRPIYNIYATLSSNLLLPRLEGSFDYLMAHHVMCHPVQTELFHYCLIQLYAQTRAKGARAFCLTLSRNDPRIEIMKRTRHHQIHAIHALHSFDQDPSQTLDRSKISYFEVGRI